MTIPFLDLQATYAELQAEIDGAVARVLASGWYIGGPEVATFEQNFARYCQTDHCIGVGNGLDALHLILRALDVGPGDEVIVASNTFIATLLAVDLVGATPVLAEPDPRTHNLDPARVEAAITTRTRVIMPTHLYGQPADLDPLLAIARAHGLYLVEDAAQAHGAEYKGRRLGGHGDAVAWSFYPGKNLGAFGDGGAVTTGNADLAERVRLFANYGSQQKYVHEVKGMNSRLDPIQATILDVKLRHLDNWNERRRAIAAIYNDLLADSGVECPHVPNWATPAWHLYVVQIAERDALQQALNAQSIQTLIHYPTPPHLQRAYEQLGRNRGSFPVAEAAAERVLSLPIGPHLAPESARQVAEAMRAWSKRSGAA